VRKRQGNTTTQLEEHSGVRTTLTFATFHNPVKITPLYDASFLIEEGNKAIYVDPAKPANFDGLPTADLILITDAAPRHLGAAAIREVSTRGTEILAPSDVVKTLGKGHALANGEMTNLFGWFIAAVPMYSLTRGPSPNALFHQKGRGNGYVLTYGSKSFYISGETEAIPEMRALKEIDFTFLCVDAERAMSPAEAAEVAKELHPAMAIPYAYGKSDPRAFAKALEASGIEVKLLNWYPQER
jgi:L-ascorbate metabolism protein UlaG (beta-lactamase superfamily)